MRKNHTQSSCVMFKIDVKIGQRILTLNVNEGDTIIDLLIKNNIATESDQQRLAELKEKIVLNIQKQIQIKLYSNQIDLAKRMQNFLNKQTNNFKQQPKSNQNQTKLSKNLAKSYLKQQQSSKTQNDLPIIKTTDQKQTPFKMLFQRTENFKNINISHLQAQKLSMDLSDQKDKENFILDSSFSQLKQSTGPINFINHLNPKHGNFNNNQHSKKKDQCQKLSHSSQKISHKKVDDDLIKAYETILLKSKDKTMRQMAQRTLKELKVYQPQKNKQQNLLPDIKPYLLQSKIRNENSINEVSGINQEIKLRKKAQSSIQSKQMKKRNNKYSYLGEEISLAYQYDECEKENRKEERKEYSYLQEGLDYKETLKKPYSIYEKVQVNNGKVPMANNHRRYNYLYE